MRVDRRAFLFLASASSAAAVLGGCRAFFGRRRRIAINPSTIRAFRLPFAEQVRLAIEAGYDGFEPWLKDLRVAKADGSLAEAVARARDAGLEFVNGIAFGQWAHPDPAVRAAGLDETKRDMELLAEIGCPRIAASLFGLQKPGAPNLTVGEAAERYARVLDLGKSYGVRPLYEYWGHSVNLCRLEEAIAVVRQVNRPDAAVLADVFHTWKGGGDFDALRQLKASELPVLHVNDVPKGLTRAAAKDADRVYPGDGCAPWARIFAALEATGADPWLSLELFNLSYQQGTPSDTLRTGLLQTRLVS